MNIDGKGNRSLLPGDIIYKDVDGDGRITDNDRRPMGWASGQQPNMNFGVQIGLGYGGFDFAADFSGASHYTWIQEWEMKVPFINDGNLNKIFTDRWHRSDIYDRNSQWTSGKYPALRYNDQGIATTAHPPSGITTLLISAPGPSNWAILCPRRW